MRGVGVGGKWCAAALEALPIATAVFVAPAAAPATTATSGHITGSAAIAAAKDGSEEGEKRANANASSPRPPLPLITANTLATATWPGFLQYAATAAAELVSAGSGAATGDDGHSDAEGGDVDEVAAVRNTREAAVHGGAEVELVDALVRVGGRLSRLFVWRPCGADWVAVAACPLPIPVPPLVLASVGTEIGNALLVGMKCSIGLKRSVCGYDLF
jgi:hypothetical protein